MAIAYHLIWTIYGTWLPNDQRGSGSRLVNSDAKSGLGELHFGRKKCSHTLVKFASFTEGQLPYSRIQ